MTMPSRTELWSGPAVRPADSPARPIIGDALERESLVAAAEASAGALLAGARAEIESLLLEPQTGSPLATDATAAYQRVHAQLVEAELMTTGLLESAADQLRQARLDADARRCDAEDEAARIRHNAEADSSGRRRASDQEASDSVAAAHADADQLRSLARDLVRDARAEVARLAARRDAILGELGNISGIIDALAVDENRPGAVRPDPAQLPATGSDLESDHHNPRPPLYATS